MPTNPLKGLESLGQSVWVDTISRAMMNSGEFQRLINEDGISGVTSNPSIFEKAIADTHDYDESIRALAGEGRSAEEIYEALTVEDIRRACDLLRPIYDRTHGTDGFASIEVSPRLAHDTAGTLEEARRLWRKVGRPNVMVKVPGTREGLPAIQQLTGEGLNINITLLFGLGRYLEVMDAYLAGLETLEAADGATNKVAGVTSVASFFLSRIDVLLDPVIEGKMKTGSPDSRVAEVAKNAHGQVAIASAKAAYRDYLERFGGERFKKLAARGARKQKLLWASTSTKNPAYSDVKYAEALIAPDTIDTMTLETIAAYRDHGKPELSLERDWPAARTVLDELPQLGINLDEATQTLEDQGVEKFDAAYNKVLAAIEKQRQAQGIPQTGKKPGGGSD